MEMLIACIIVVVIIVGVVIIRNERRSENIKKGLSGGTETPALLALVEEKWIEQAFDYFKNTGKNKLYFLTNSGIGSLSDLKARQVYFKLKGKTDISLKADFIELLDKNPSQHRLPGYETENGKYYYGYKNLRWLSSPVKLVDLKHFKSRQSLRADVPGACVIIDPVVE